MKPGEVLSQFDIQMRRDRVGGAMQRVEKDAHVTRVLGDIKGAEFGCVLYSALDEKSADHAIESEIRYFRLLGRPFEWKVFEHDKPADLGDRLVKHGFKPGDIETVVALELKEPLDVTSRADVKIRRLESPGELTALDAFETPEPLLLELRAELEQTPECLSVFVASVGGKTVSRGWIRYYPDRNFADLWGGNTLREYRGRGIYKALVAARAEEARRRNVRYLTTDALPTSRPILERLGFQRLTRTTPYLWMEI